MSDTYDTTKHANGSDTELTENTQKEAEESTEAKVSWADASPEWATAVNPIAEEQEMEVGPKPKKRGRPKGVKVKAKTTKAAAPPKPSGKKPKKKAKESSVQLDDFGFRKGSIRSKAATMYSRPNGATLTEVKNKLGSVQYNALAALKDKGFKVTSKEEDGKANRPATRFFLHAKKR